MSWAGLDDGNVRRCGCLVMDRNTPVVGQGWNGFSVGVPNRIRTGVANVKGSGPRPLDDGNMLFSINFPWLLRNKKPRVFGPGLLAFSWIFALEGVSLCPVFLRRTRGEDRRCQKPHGLMFFARIFCGGGVPDCGGVADGGGDA